MMTSQGKAIDLEIRLESSDVLRNMGCRKGASIRPEHRELVERLINETSSMLQPRGTYCVQPVSRMTDSELVLAGQRPIRGPIAGFLRPAVRVAAFVVTVGDKIEQLSTQHMQNGSRLEGFIFNAIGSAAADAAVDALADVIYFEEAAPEEALTPPFSPGYCGLPLDEQISLFAMLNSKAVGVRLLPTMIMQPLKSVSGLIGIGSSDEIESHGVPCEWCDLKNCSMRR